MPPSCSPDAASRARLHRLLETTVLVALLAGLACPAWAQDGAASIRAERAALWHVAMAVPDGPDREFRFRDVRVHDDGALPGEGGPLICGALEFEDADAGIVRFALSPTGARPWAPRPRRGHIRRADRGGGGKRRVRCVTPPPRMICSIAVAPLRFRLGGAP
ncbi:hypothetical protein [Plastoroseomonas hellenica]|uniref:hypothetical protein n=1 Tax=Plastoroseomonas hellenica TaxID=2687306 RepID=UPI001BA53F60|nr:hypothetical protein [Plastoroseomonas hellenica]MBR0644483.1 hypothetical protein [Plastoroseomonas hellenica]